MCLLSKNCQIKGKIKAIDKEIPTNEKTITGGNHGIFPLLPRTNNNAAELSPAIKQVINFLKNNFRAMSLSWLKDSIGFIPRFIQNLLTIIIQTSNHPI